MLYRRSMKRFQLFVLASFIAGVSAVAFSSVALAQARQCSAERPADARSYWSYRIIDGRKCWYEGKPMLSKTLLHWSTAQTAQADTEQKASPPSPSTPNFLDAQASMPDNSDSFEARWRQRFLDAVRR